MRDRRFFSAVSDAETAFKFHMRSSNCGFVQGDLVFVKVECVFYFWTCIPVQGVVTKRCW